MKYVFHHNKSLDATLEYYNEMLNAYDGQQCRGRKYKSGEDEVEVIFSDGTKLIAFGSELEEVKGCERE